MMPRPWSIRSTLEPLATVLRQDGAGFVYTDLGLPPLGASARRFGDPNLPPDGLIFELEELPPSTLMTYCIDAAHHSSRRRTKLT